nr:MAG TPA: hypothetical protein [Caudoviricetes sp.]
MFGDKNAVPTMGVASVCDSNAFRSSAVIT